MSQVWTVSEAVTVRSCEILRLALPDRKHSPAFTADSEGVGLLWPQPTTPQMSDLLAAVAELSATFAFRE